MAIIRINEPDRFTRIDCKMLEDGGISWAAKGLLCYLLSRPNNWRVNVEHLSGFTADSAKPTRRDGVYSLLNELSELGFVVRRAVRGVGGLMGGYDYLVYDSPLPAQPFTDKPDTVQPFTANPTLTKTERATKTEKETNAPPGDGAASGMKLPESKGKRAGSGKNPPVTFAEFCQLCEDAGEKRIEQDDPVFADMAAAGIPADYLALHWRWFVRWAGELDAKGKDRKYAGTRGWRQVFRKSVRECWSKLWWKDNKSGQWVLTQAGIMAQAAQNNGRE